MKYKTEKFSSLTYEPLFNIVVHADGSCLGSIFLFTFRLSVCIYVCPYNISKPMYLGSPNVA